jgi:Spy/CpxP family protein refolding chaperone
MASHRLAVTALTALALAAAPAFLNRANADQPGGKDRERLTAWASKLGLSADQQERIHKICTECAERAEPVEEQLWKLHHEAFDQVKGVLTPEQQEKLPSAIKNEIAKECRAMEDKLGLSEEQRQKVEKVREEYEPKFREVCSQATETARKQMRELRSEFFAGLRGVLNDDQKAKLFGVLRQEFHQWRDPVARQQHLEAIGEQLGVNAEQKTQIQKIRSEYEPKIERLATQLKDTFQEERASVEKVLTDEQRTKAQEMWKQIGGAFGIKGRE